MNNGTAWIGVGLIIVNFFLVQRHYFAPVLAPGAPAGGGTSGNLATGEKSAAAMQGANPNTAFAQSRFVL